MVNNIKRPQPCTINNKEEQYETYKNKEVGNKENREDKQRK